MSIGSVPDSGDVVAGIKTAMEETQTAAEGVNEAIEANVSAVEAMKSIIDTGTEGLNAVKEYLEGLAGEMAGHGLPSYNEAAGAQKAEVLASEFGAVSEEADTLLAQFSEVSTAIEEWSGKLEGLVNGCDELKTQHQAIIERNDQ